VRRFLGAAVVTTGLVLGLAPAAQSQTARTDVILAGSKNFVDYHAEAAPATPADGGSTIIAGNIHIKTDRAEDDGVAGACDPDPREGTHPRPEDAPDRCTYAEPVGEGEDFIAFGRAIQDNFDPLDAGELLSDTDTSPNGAFVPVSTESRERFNGRGGLDEDGLLFMDDREVLDDEDLNLRIVGTRTFAYQAPRGLAENRWRRLCGEGVVGTIDNNAGVSAPFVVGQTRQFVIQIWDADFQNPSDEDGGNQDYFIIDVLKPGTPLDELSCQIRQNVPNKPEDKPVNPPSSPTSTPTVVTPAAPAAGVGAVVVQRRRGTAQIAAVRACPTTSVPLRVRGRLIRRVTFFVDGRRVGAATRANAAGQFQVRVDPRRMRAGTHRVRAVVQFRSGAGPSRTLRMSFRVCARPARQVSPNFTG
jgi:hypothetical protein